MKRTIAALAASAAMLGTTVGVAGAAGASTGSPQQTTLDACGYFYGLQSSSTTKTDATTTTKGTWVGVWNNYVDTRVASLGTVQGAFSETTSTYTGATGLDTQGTESFTSNAGKIDQTFSYGPDIVGGFNVDVTATRDLSFLTSNTNGACYSGPFPRP
jgi:hypothetical protein